MGIMLGDIEHDVFLGDVEQDVWLGDVQQNEVDAACVPSPEAALVLARYTGLTDRETFAICRFVNASALNGNWALIDEAYPLSLYTEANALIAMKAKTAINNGGVLSAGLGFYIDGVNNVDTDFDEVNDSVNYALQDGYISCVYNDITIKTFSIFRTNNTNNYWTESTTNILTKSQDQSFNISASIEQSALVEYDRNGTGEFLKVYRNNILLGVTDADGTNLTGNNFLLGNEKTGSQPIEGYMRFFSIGGSIGFDRESWYTDVNQCMNELEIGQAATVDYNVQNKTYDWSNRELLEIQLDELAQIIVDNSDAVTTGRSFDITGNLGISTGAQANLDILVTNGWVIIQ